MTRYSITSACFAVVAVVLVSGVSAADIEYGKYLAGECVTCGFFDDDRETSEKAFGKATVCMKGCKPKTEVLNRARSVDVGPEKKGAPKVE